MTTETTMIEGDVRALQDFLQFSQELHENRHIRCITNQGMTCMFFLQPVHADVVLQISHIQAASLMLRSFPYHHHLPPTDRCVSGCMCLACEHPVCVGNR